MGVYGHHTLVVEATFTNLKERGIDIGLYRNNMLKAFNKLIFSLDMGDYDINLPITLEIYKDPNHPVTKLILILYSMEPPFYGDYNKACTSLDHKHLKTLGPFAMALYKVLYWGCGSGEKRDDAL